MNILGVKLRNILLNDEPSVHVEYLRFKNTFDIYSNATGECFLMKDQITKEEVAWISQYLGKVDVFTMHANSYSSSECVDRLRDVGININYVDSIDLNFFHSDQTLFIFKEFRTEISGSTVPNTIKIYPVKRNEIIIPIVATEQNDVGDGSTDCIVKSDNSAALNSNLVRTDIVDGETSLNHLTKQDLIRQELKRQFDKNFSFVKVQFRGVHIERMSIPLSKFYEKNGISGGRLKGSWTLLEKENLDQMMDRGILDRAVNEVSKKYTIRIPKYGQIVRTENIEEYIKDIKKIETDFREYISGQNKGNKIGEIQIQKEFSPYQAIDEGFMLLEAYLNQLESRKNKGYLYKDAIQDFLNVEHAKCNNFSTRVLLSINEMEYRERQWNDPEFVESILCAFYDYKNKNSDFSKEDEEFIELLEKYLNN